MLEAAFNTLDGRTTALSAAVHSLTADFTLCSAQVSELVRLSALQYVAPTQHSSSAASAGAADASSAAAGGSARDGLGWPLNGMKATATVFGPTPDRGGAGGETFGGQGRTGP